VQRAGGPVERDHGFVFEVPATMEIRRTEPTPLTGLGRFNHEAAAVEPTSGCVYLTEDRGGNGSLSPADRGLGLFYRFVPREPGRLHLGGRLQALQIRDLPSADLTNWTGARFPVGSKAEVVWVDLQEPESPRDDLRLQGRARGAAGFTRGEGLWRAGDGLYFCCTDGGERGAGQVWKYVPSPDEGTAGERRSPGRLELFIEPNAPSLLENCDGLTMSPWGDLILCEDGPGSNSLVGVTPQGKLYRLAETSRFPSEFAGATFSPDGGTLFVNLQRAGMTLAISAPDGSWRRLPDQA
jgi:secreted PhoX family phosphatase